MTAMGDHVVVEAHDQDGRPCLFHIHTNQTKPHYAEAVSDTRRPSVWL